MNETDNLAERLIFNVDWSWGDSTQYYAWHDMMAELVRLDPEIARAIQMNRNNQYHRWSEYNQFWARQRRLKREARFGRSIYNDMQKGYI